MADALPNVALAKWPRLGDRIVRTIGRGGRTAKPFVAFLDLTAGEAGCWPWRGRRHRKGYGYFGTRAKAHRVAYELAFGVALAPSQFVLHRCDNPPCCNPAHLAVGTNADNVADRQAKGRQHKGARIGHIPRGEEIGRAKLTADDVRAIRASDDGPTALAARYGLNKRTVLRIRKRERWAHVGEQGGTDATL